MEDRLELRGNHLQDIILKTMAAQQRCQTNEIGAGEWCRHYNEA
jgi:hypothetical protein